MTTSNTSHFVVLPGMAGFHVHVDDNGDVEFNMTLLDFIKNDMGEHGKLTDKYEKVNNVI